MPRSGRRCGRNRGPSRDGGGAEVHHGETHAGRAVFRVSRHRHHPGHRLNGTVVGRRLGRRAGLAVARDRTIDQVGLDCLHRLIPEAEAVDHARPEVLHHDVGVLDQPSDDFESARVFEVERQRPLVGIHGQEERRHAGLANVVVGADAAALVAGAGFLDLDHIRAQQPELHGRERTGEHLGKIDDPNAGESLGHGEVPRWRRAGRRDSPPSWSGLTRPSQAKWIKMVGPDPTMTRVRGVRERSSGKPERRCRCTAPSFQPPTPRP